MSVSPGRTLCPRCGSNNFDTQAACWKCGAALGARAAAPRPAAPAASPAPGVPLPPAPVDPAVATGAAVSLAFLMPFIAVPVGLVFLMLDDRRKVQLGRLTLFWGTVFSVLHLLVTVWLFNEAVAQVRGLLPGLPGQSQPRPETPVPPIRFPGYPQ